MTEPSPSDAPRRPFPVAHEHELPYWTAGARGELVVQRCGECQHLNHPPTLRCRHDHSADLEWTVVSGRARVEGWSVNEQQWFPGFPAPYVVALVALDEDPSARLLTNLVNVKPSAIRAGMEVQARFERVVEPDGDGEVWLPLFEPPNPNDESDA
jgi:uncharacterized OB-fold protein